MASIRLQEALDILVKNIGLKPNEQTCSYSELLEKHNILQGAIYELEELEKETKLYKKAFELYIKETSSSEIKKEDCFVRFVCTNTDCNKCIERRYLMLARKELENV